MHANAAFCTKANPGFLRVSAASGKPPAPSSAMPSAAPQRGFDEQAFAHGGGHRVAGQTEEQRALRQAREQHRFAGAQAQWNSFGAEQASASELKS